ncbi:MAG: sarcosine oxidase subunit gamma [Rhodobacteraceae bacterium]|jgi:sarcosine oxidase subunit gamma|nr:sarcosine oxidase subunit gamma [Paracoccaceae bacterium]
MAEAMTALGGAATEGAIRVAEAPPTGMIALRADLSTRAVGKAVKEATGIALPRALRIETAKDRSVAWMAPDEVLVFCPWEKAAGLAADLSEGLGDTPHLVADMSSARALIDLSGPGWREVLAKGTPVDLAPGAFGPGDFRRTRLGQVAVAIWASGPERAHLICFRSVAGFVFDWLSMAAARDSLPGLWR